MSGPAYSNLEAFGPSWPSRGNISSTDLGFSPNLIHQMVNLSKWSEPGPFVQKGAETQLPSSAKRTCQRH